MSELDLQYFFFELPIYKKISITPENYEEFQQIINLGRGSIIERQIQIEGYNPFKRTESTFSPWENFDNPNGFEIVGGTGMISLRCLRYDDKLYYFVNYDASTKTFMKVGQYPSVADFHIHELKHFEKVISKEKLKEFSKAIGLAANGVGIGSFVYLRRIFEHLIWDDFNTYQNELGLSKNDFETSRMEDKINTLKGHLPQFLVENKSLYSIMSKGIHELSEQECLEYFPVVKSGIELILEEKHDEYKKKQKIEEAKKSITTLAGKISSQKKPE